MKWVLRIILGLILLIAIGVGALMILRPLAPPLVIAEPGDKGRRISEPDVFGNYYPTADEGVAPGILIMGGSEGGLGTGTKQMALALQSEGYNVLHLSFYRAEGQPKDLIRVPLETFENGLDWLKKQPEVDADRLAVMGASKGAEAGLILASRRNDVAAAILGAPSNVSWAGINWAFGGAGFDSSWSLNGEPYPFLPYAPYDNETGIYSLYEGGLGALDAHPEAVIKVENIAGEVLLICGENDTLWPACPMSRLAKERSATMNGPEVTILAYENAGHFVSGLPLASDSPNLDNLTGWGGTAEGNNNARADSWEKTLLFLEERLEK